MLKSKTLLVFLAVVLVVAVPLTSFAQERMGAWVDDVVLVQESDPSTVIMKLLAGEIDSHATSMADPAAWEQIQQSPILDYSIVYGGSRELTFNPVGPVFPTTDKLNPFNVPRIREAMNWMIDRQYIVDEIMNGFAIPGVVPVPANHIDYSRHASVIRELELEYAYNPEQGSAVVQEEMVKLGATLVNGKWHYNNEPVVLIGVIRNDDERLEMGDYFSNILEDLGFTVDRQYKNMSEANPIWIFGDPADGAWHFYTGGWGSSVINRDSSVRPEQMYTTRLMSFSPLWLAYTPDPRLDELAQRLYNNDYQDMAERAQLWEELLPLTLQDSVRIWVTDSLEYIPRRTEMQVVSDLAAGIGGSQLWPYTLRRIGEVGGSVTLGLQQLLDGPWNPVGGSNSVYDQAAIRGTADRGIMYDPYTGLVHPQRIERAELYATKGLPISKSHDWITLEFVDSINVPGDAWAEWDAAEQRFITVAEKYPEGVTSWTKSVVYYPEELFETTWHDGSQFSIADILLFMILGSFDRAQEASSIYDASAISAYNSLMSYFKGVRIVSENPLVIETYVDSYALDAELAVNSWYPVGNLGTGPWHTLGLGIRAEAAKEVAFSRAKATEIDSEYLGMAYGPTVSILAKHLGEAAATGFIPYEKFLSQYISAEEIASRWSNLQAWYGSKGHFWVASGPLYLERAYPVEKQIHLRRYENYIDPAAKWDRFGVPMFAEAEIEGSTRVSIGAAAEYDVVITFNDQPYLVSDMDVVRYLVISSTGEIVVGGEATPEEDGLWTITLSADDTSKLNVGASTIEVIVTPKAIAIPTFVSMQVIATR